MTLLYRTHVSHLHALHYGIPPCMQRGMQTQKSYTSIFKTSSVQAYQFWTFTTLTSNLVTAQSFRNYQLVYRWRVVQPIYNNETGRGSVTWQLLLGACSQTTGNSIFRHCSLTAPCFTAAPSFFPQNIFNPSLSL